MSKQYLHNVNLLQFKVILCIYICIKYCYQK